jgi:CRISPR-associated protein Cas5d
MSQPRNNNNHNHNNRVTIRVWGDFACFTRPEMKVERVSYPVITPSAARGILEAIFWEPQMYYLIDRIHIVKRGRWFSVRRNEVTKVISLRQPSPIHAGGGAEDGTQRNTLALQDVEYLITAEVKLSTLAQQPRDNLGKYKDKIKNRAAAGKCFYRPCLGVREFDANFDFVEDADTFFQQRQSELSAVGTPFVPIPYEPLGLILYDVFDHAKREDGFLWLREEEIEAQKQLFAQGLVGLKKSEQTKRRKETAPPARWTNEPLKPQASFFQAEIKNSIINCHPDRVKILTQTTGGTD